MMTAWTRIALASTAAALLAGCNADNGRFPARAYAPIPSDTLSLMAQKGTSRDAPVLVRAYKKESELEVWKQSANGQYVLLKTYPVCRWSGQLGPKKREGDRQVPEGFYTVTASQMNPNSAYWLSFNVGYPNTLERAMGRNGGDIMVHGTCSSRGCFAMTNEQVEEIYAVMREAFAGGQKQVQFQSYPFRMTAENLARFRYDPNMPYWKNLKEGSDHFEVAKTEPRVGYCGGKYVFNATATNGRMEPLAPCPALKVDEEIAAAVSSKERADEQQVAEYVQRGTPAVRVQYSDGSQHASFRTTALAYFDTGSDSPAMAPLPSAPKRDIGDVSRPEAIGAVEEVHLDDSGKPKVAARPAAPTPVAAAAAKPAPASAEASVTSVAKADTKPASSSGLFSLFGGSPTPVAETAAAPAPSVDQPFYKRWLGLGGDAPAAAPQPAAVPLPPRRQADAAKPARLAMTAE
ncbi:murein L,D-transpeptidase [Alsobacter sp. SYSU M60028]|uniref:Murein L,D-transpeptidase n=1 Tax=Alsobacter ponti TaxID=2962936 RepID=A0ABT1LGN6_9HYPH|nr:murein L,D-transpeptidase family protein [Alsobacter ponti]MCP8940666.1 murein L,D-transpeptidase [Alsobacter ponti]